MSELFDVRGSILKKRSETELLTVVVKVTRRLKSLYQLPHCELLPEIVTNLLPDAWHVTYSYTDLAQNVFYPLMTGIVYICVVDKVNTDSIHHYYKEI